MSWSSEKALLWESHCGKRSFDAATSVNTSPARPGPFNAPLLTVYCKFPALQNGADLVARDTELRAARATAKANAAEVLEQMKK